LKSNQKYDQSRIKAVEVRALLDQVMSYTSQFFVLLMSSRVCFGFAEVLNFLSFFFEDIASNETVAEAKAEEAVAVVKEKSWYHFRNAF